MRKLRVLNVVGECGLPKAIGITMPDGQTYKYEFQNLIYIDEEKGIAFPDYRFSEIMDESSLH